MIRIGVIGCGYVGLVAACCWASSGYEVIAAEKDQRRLGLLKERIPPIREPSIDNLLRETRNSLTFTHDVAELVRNVSIAVVAVGTPSLPDGQVDLTQVREVCETIAAAAAAPVTLVMKSTVPPGTGVRLVREILSRARVPIRYVANPEFLREGKAVWDWFHPDRIVVGSDDPVAIEQTLALYENIDAPKLVMDVTSAEMVKYAANAFLATKISFINEIANLCEIVGADIDVVAPALGMDKRIGASFLSAGLGYGGSCFPKDTRALCYMSSTNGYDFRLLRSVIEVNARQRALAVDRLSWMLGGLRGRAIAILGLAFKPGTDDVREAPALEIARKLVEGGAIVRAHDPVAIANARVALGDLITFADSPYTCVQGAEALLLATEWEEYKQLDWSRVKSLMRPPYAVLDGRNALDKRRLTELGFFYVGFGRPRCRLQEG